MIQTAVNPIAVPPDVSAFAAAQGVAAELPAVVAMTQRVFPDATLSVSLEDDPEIPNDCHILLAAREVNLDVDESLAASWEWDRQLFLLAPAPKVCIFRLSMAGVR